MSKEQIPNPGENKERIYEERKLLGEIAIDSGEVSLVDPSYTNEVELHGITVPVGNDGSLKVFGVYKITEYSVPKEFAQGKENATTKNIQLLRLEFEKA